MSSPLRCWRVVENTLRILHPLPRVGEIAQDVDDTPYAYYVEQAQGGLYVRQSILCEVLGLEVND